METLKKILVASLTLVIGVLTLRFLKGGGDQGDARRELEKAENETQVKRGEYDHLETKVQGLKEQEFEGTKKSAEEYWKGVTDEDS